MSVRYRWAIGVLVILLAIGLLYGLDPEDGHFLPCPFRWATGLLCPGCGSQRALHDLLHGRVGEAFGHNAILMVSLPLLGLQWAISRTLPSGRPLEADNRVVFAWGVLLVTWGILRNMPFMAGTGH